MESEVKKKIALFLGEKSGVSFHRLVLPHALLREDADILFGFKEISELEGYDILVFNRCLPKGWLEELREKYPKLKVICDIDDYWVLSNEHVCYNTYKEYDLTYEIIKHIKGADYVTTTTPILSNSLKQLNPNVYIFPNALFPDSEFIPNHKPSDKIRVGVIGGCTHILDFKLLEGITKALSEDVKNKVQFVLGGFNKGTWKIPQEDGTFKEELMDWEDNVWVKMERVLTDNYTTISQQHKEFLDKHLNIDYDTDEAYKRIWSRDVWKYATMYDEIDILLVPLVDNTFNRCKSELKMIEASVKGVPVIVSDTLPYTLCATPDNCILVNNRKGARGFAKAITRLVRDKDLRDLLTENIKKLTEEGGKYNLKKVSEDRLNFYKGI